MAVVQKLLDTLEAELNYFEKDRPEDEYTDKVGSRNYTKYAHEIDTKYPNFYNGKKDGYAWCDVFVDWCFINAYGEPTAKLMLRQPSKSLGAGVGYSKGYYKSAGALYTTPKVGDQVFFGEQHTGVVVAVNGNQFITIEGNTTGGVDTVNGEGGHVAKKVYNKIDKTWTFGRPRWESAGGYDYTSTAPVAPRKTFDISLSQVMEGDNGPRVESIQQLLIAKKYTCGKTGADGDFGKNTKSAVIKFQKDVFPNNATKWDGIVGPDTYSALLGAI